MGSTDDWSSRVPVRRYGVAVQLAIALACVLAALVVRWPFATVLGLTLPFATLFPALLIAAVLGGRTAGMATLVLGGVAALVLPGNAPGWSVAAYVTWLVTGGSLYLVAVLLRDLVFKTQEQRDALDAGSARLKTVVREMGHRSKNGLTVISAIVQQTARTAESVADLETKLVNRLAALGSAQDIVTEAAGKPTRVDEIVARVLAPFSLDRFELAHAADDDCRLAADPTSTAALILHELATNAVKHGALSAPEGRVRLAWRCEDGMVVLDWRETGGPPVAESAATGFGLRLLRTALQSYGGFAEINFPASGLQCSLKVPAADS